MPLQTMNFCLYVFEEPAPTAAKKFVAKTADAKTNAKKNDVAVLADVINKELHISWFNEISEIIDNFPNDKLWDIL